MAWVYIIKVVFSHGQDNHVCADDDYGMGSIGFKLFVVEVSRLFGRSPYLVLGRGHRR
jgi:hypothetical protein